MYPNDPVEGGDKEGRQGEGNECGQGKGDKLVPREVTKLSSCLLEEPGYDRVLAHVTTR